MSAYGLKPKFIDQAGYRKWRQEWRLIYRKLASDIRKAKATAKNLQRTEPLAEKTGKLQKELALTRAMATKLMSVLDEAKERWRRITEMMKALETARAQYPLTLEDCRHVDFSFNRGHNEFPMIPMWMVKAKGQTFYISHLESDVGFDTREKPNDQSTKGSIRWRNVSLDIDSNGCAHVKRK